MKKLLTKSHWLKKILLIAIISTSISGCKPAVPTTKQFDASVEVRERALEFAQLYAASDTEYLWGGQDPLFTIKMDCSGLVVMCYKYALVDTAYSMPFDDTTAAAMHDSYARPTNDPQPGDLIFMGSADGAAISHIAIFKEKKDGIIYFIDSTLKDAEGEYPAVDGVSERNYPETDERFKSFGILQVINSH